jgi:hypothetical protein
MYRPRVLPNSVSEVRELLASEHPRYCFPNVPFLKNDGIARHCTPSFYLGGARFYPKSNGQFHYLFALPLVPFMVLGAVVHLLSVSDHHQTAGFSHCL